MAGELKQGQWYWLRRGTNLVPYRFHRIRESHSAKLEGEFVVGSMIVVFPLSAVVGEARGPAARE